MLEFWMVFFDMSPDVPTFEVHIFTSNFKILNWSK